MKYLSSGSLQRLVLSKYKDEEADLNRITIRPVQIKDQQLLSFLYEYRTNRMTKHLTLPEHQKFTLTTNQKLFLTVLLFAVESPSLVSSKPLIVYRIGIEKS
jgi:hypothetical protein